MVSNADENGYKRQVPSETIFEGYIDCSVHEIPELMDELAHALEVAARRGGRIRIVLEQELPKAANALKKSKVA